MAYVEQFVVAIAGKIVGSLEIGFELGDATTDISVEELRGDRWSLEHAGNEGQQLVGEFAHEVERDIAGAYIGGAFHNDATEVEELSHLLGRLVDGGFGKELVGSMGLALERLVGTTGFEGEVELENADSVVAEEVQCVAVGQGMLLRYERQE